MCAHMRLAYPRSSVDARYDLLKRDFPHFNENDLVVDLVRHADLLERNALHCVVLGLDPRSRADARSRLSVLEECAKVLDCAPLDEALEERAARRASFVLVLVAVHKIAQRAAHVQELGFGQQPDGARAPRELEGLVLFDGRDARTLIGPQCEAVLG